MAYQTYLKIIVLIISSFIEVRLLLNNNLSVIIILLKGEYKNYTIITMFSLLYNISRN